MSAEESADLAGMFDVDDFAVSAIWRAGGVGAPLAVPVIRDAPNRVADAFGTPILQATNELRVRVESLPALAAGDTFTIGTEILTVQHAEREATGALWRVLCQ
jgi:hypothetical protein